MLKVTEHDMAEELEQYLTAALQQPVVIEKAGREALVVLSMVEYERLQEAEDAYWLANARKANVEGYLDHTQAVRQRLAAGMTEQRHKPPT
ncbi:MAG: type II toxin-antitoxin system prevent-host-death family antitoxin [Sphingomonadaceae bacterium]